MGQTTKIEWCDHTFNPWRGCSKVSDGCKHCYAEKQSLRNPKALGVWGDNGARVIASESMWAQPLKWNREAEAAGKGRRVFCGSMCDVFEDHWKTYEPRSRLFDLILATPHLDWLLLTKRPENVAGMVATMIWPEKPLGRVEYRDDAMFDSEDPLPTNVWLGTSVEDQAAADERIPHLLQTPAAVRFLSVEPLLGPVDLSKWLPHRGVCEECWSEAQGREARDSGVSVTDHYYAVMAEVQRTKAPCTQRIHQWVIVGGESGPKARPCNLEWIRSIVQQCMASGVPVFVKQLGARPTGIDNGCDACQGGYDVPRRKHAIDCPGRPLEDPKGGDPDEWPADLRVREFPTPTEIHT